MKLYEIAEDIRKILADFEAGEYDKEVCEELLEQVNIAFDDKVLATAGYVKELDTTAAAMHIALAELQRRHDRALARSVWLRQYLKTQMEKAGKTKIEGVIYDVALRKNPPRVVIDDPTSVPGNFMTTPAPPQPKPNLPAIKAFLKELGEDEDCYFAHLEQDERLDIKS